MRSILITAVLVCLGGCGGLQPVNDAETSLPVSDMPWKIQTVIQTQGSGSSMVLDSSDVPHIAFVSPGGLGYATRAGSEWRVEDVERAPGIGRSCAIVLDQEGRPWIAYTQAGHPKSARWDGSRWSIERVTSDEALQVETVSLAMGPDHVPHMSLTDPNACLLWHAARLDDGWHGEAVDALCEGVALSESYGSIQVDRAGGPRIAYSYYNGRINLEFRKDLRYAQRFGQAWRTETVESDGMGACPSIAVDSSGRPSIGYFDAVHGTLKIASWDGESWNISVVDRDINRGCGYSSLALDAKGVAHISYLHQDPRQIRYARGRGAHWARWVVQPAGPEGGFTSIRLDSSGAPHFLYYDGMAYKYAKAASR